jgi:hypothetical protein
VKYNREYNYQTKADTSVPLIHTGLGKEGQGKGFGHTGCFYSHFFLFVMVPSKHDTLFSNPTGCFSEAIYHFIYLMNLVL